MLQKNKGQKIWSYTVDALLFLAGSVLYAIAINIFTAPNNIAPGGATGIATLVNYLSGAPIGVVMLLLNIPLFIWGWLELGYRFVARTIAATVSTSAVLDLLAPFLPEYRGDTMLAAIFGGIFAGAGLALIFMRGGTTGGSDLVARLISRHFRHISMGRLILIIDVAVVLASAAVYRNYESPLYALIVIFINTKLIDSILYGMDEGNGKMMFIISQKSREIAPEILQDMGRGVTMLESRGAYSGREGEVLLCAVRRHEVYKTYDIVRSIDPQAFIIVGDAGEITGEGFRLPEEKRGKKSARKADGGGK